MKSKIQFFIIFCLAVSLMTFGNACAKKQIKEVIPVQVVDTSAADAAKKRAEEEAAAAAKKRAEVEAAQKLLQDQINNFESENIYFDYNKADLKSETQATLEKKAKFLQANSSYSVRIEGNCDERGTNEYNLALGDRRADAAKKFLNSLGISADRINTISYGEEKPVDTGHDEAAWSKNRRDEFKLVK